MLSTAPRPSTADVRLYETAIEIQAEAYRLGDAVTLFAAAEQISRLARDCADPSLSEGIAGMAEDLEEDAEVAEALEA